MPSTIFAAIKFLPWVLVVVLLILNFWVFVFSSSTNLNEDGVWIGEPIPGKPLALNKRDKKDLAGMASAEDASRLETTKASPVASTKSPEKIVPLVVKGAPKTSDSTKFSGKKGFLVEAGSFLLDREADSLLKGLSDNGFEPHVEMVRETIGLNNVQAGPFPQLEDGKEAESILKAAGIPVSLEETWEGFVVSLGQSPLLGYAMRDLEKARNLGVKTLRVVKVQVDRPVRKVLIGPYSTNNEAKKVVSRVSKLGLAVPVIREWTAPE